jgi:signal transduction histidine kinase
MSVTATTPPPKSTETAVPRPGEPAAERGRDRRVRWVPGSLRARIVAWFIGVLALMTLALVLVTYEVLLIRLDQRIDTELQQEAAELRRLASGRDPATGEPFGSRVERIFDVFLQRNIPSPNEALITFVAGEPYKRSALVVPYRLDEDPELVARWSRLARTDRSSVLTPVGRVEYLAVPVRVGLETNGVFVAAIFRDRLREDADSVVFAAGAVGLAVLLLGSLLAWRLADRVVRPVTALTRAARSISETDFSARIPEHGRDEVAQLASTFNDMLDRLERAFASQRRFVDDAGHELRTPLTIVRGHLELLGDDPDEQRETIALVTDELERMGRIVDDLILLAKYEEPDFLDFSAVELAELTDELLAKSSALAPREWVLEERGKGVIIADRQRLTQAVAQLAENAARHGEPGAPIVLGSSLGRGEARIWVRDRGPGVRPSERAAIFERFRRGAGRGRSEGSGLGLAIVRTIAEAHHGRVELESEVGVGSTFTIVVPVDQPTPDESEP